MQSMNEIRHHIKAIEQTRKITNAMFLISSARVKKVMPRVEYNRKFLSQVHSAMRHILASSDNFDHAYLRDRGDRRTAYVVMAGDKGMVGEYNSNVLKFALPYINDGKENHLITVGITGSVFFRRKGITPDREIVGVSQEPSVESVRHLTQDIFRMYDERSIERVFLIYTGFYNSAKCVPRIQRLLPVDTSIIGQAERKSDMIYHPSADETFRQIVPQYTMDILFGALMQSYASEHCARMNAMQSATRNADELLQKLKLQYNAARQAAITREITEITGAALALGNMEVSNDGKSLII